MEPAWFYALIILLPVAAMAGWLAAQGSMRRRAGEPPWRPDYLQGLNHVLNEQPDQAIDIFIKMVQVDSETIETHLALGHLFRRRGEVARAIRIHQNLIARPALTAAQRQAVLLELARDYMRAGLLDRAEALFTELLELSGNAGSYAEPALQGLLAIYQQEQDWEQAIAIASRLQAGARSDVRFGAQSGAHSGLPASPYPALIAQFYCEQAEQLGQAGRLKEAQDRLRRALNTDPKCVRASLMEGQAAEQAGQHQQAITAYKRVARQSAAYIGEALAPLYRCYQRSGRLAECKAYMQALYQSHTDPALLLMLTQLHEQLEGEPAALRFIAAELKACPTVAGVDQLIAYAIKLGGHHLRTIKELTARLLADTVNYQCANCGFATETLNWRCPGCKQWATIKPLSSSPPPISRARA